MDLHVNCADCKAYACYFKGKIPENCPMKVKEIQEIYRASIQKYLSHDTVRNLALNAARVESEGYLRWTRIEETIEFARRCGFKRLGIAFCIGLRDEAKVLADVLRRNGFEVFSVVCKSGSIDKEVIGLRREEKVRKSEFEAMCNPVAQAEILNKAGTELNLILGLCVGHDTLFIMHSKAPVTCIAVKDRVLAHNPLGAIYAKHYFRRKLYEDHAGERDER
ncbi:MAG: DUF1847 domain-containing protein [Archaeoglobi archaeon]|nr:DUF1847 domain-containing protein [Candidatus Mnemosynella sp.]